MSRTIPDLDILIEDAKTTLYALYAERRQLREAAKPPRQLKGWERRKLVVGHFRAGMPPKDIAKTLGCHLQTIKDHIKYHAIDIADEHLQNVLKADWRAKDYWDNVQKMSNQLIQSKFNDIPVYRP